MKKALMHSKDQSILVQMDSWRRKTFEWKRHSLFNDLNREIYLSIFYHFVEKSSIVAN